MTQNEMNLLTELANKYNIEKKQNLNTQYGMQNQTQQQQSSGIEATVQELKTAVDSLREAIGLQQQQQQQPQQLQYSHANGEYAKLDDVMKAFNMYNVNNMQQPGSSTVPTIDSVTAEIINPPLPDFGKEQNGGFINGK